MYRFLCINEIVFLLCALLIFFGIQTTSDLGKVERFTRDTTVNVQDIQASRFEMSGCIVGTGNKHLEEANIPLIATFSPSTYFASSSIVDRLIEIANADKSEEENGVITMGRGCLVDVLLIDRL